LQTSDYPIGLKADPVSASRSILRQVPLIGLLVVLAVGGLWVSYHHFRWQWRIDGDIAGPYLIWKQVLRDGPGVLTEWRYAQDSWLLSLTLPDFLLLWLSNNSPWAILLQGWAIFLLTILLTYTLLRSAVSRLVAAGAAIAMLFAGPAVLGGVIYLAYPITHNISLLFGLGSLWLFGKWLRSGHWRWLGLGGLTLFIGHMSDPWLGAALTLPAVLAAGICAVLGPDRRARLAGIALCTLLVFIAARSRLGGLLWFIPGSDFALGGVALWPPHLGWIATYTTIMFNVVPVRQQDFDWLPNLWLMVVNCTIVAVLVVWASVRLWWNRRSLRAETRFLVATAFIGSAAIGAAFTLSNVNANLNVGRYLSNWFYFLPWLVVIAAFGTPTPRVGWLRRVAIVWAALFAVSGIAAAPAHQTAVPDDIAAPKTRDLIRFLNEHDLTYGYGPFWAALGGSADWLTNGHIVIRPVSRLSSGRIGPWNSQTFASWYTSADIPAGQKSFFYLAIPDGDLCPDVPTCVAMANRDWGPPDRVLQFHEFPVLVWDHPTLTGLPGADLIRQAPVMQPGVPVHLSQTGTGAALQGRGWSGVEETGAWTEAKEAVLMIHLPDDWSGPATLRFNAYGFPARTKRNPQTVTVTVDGEVLATWSVALWHSETYDVVVPANIAERKTFALVLKIPGASRPSDFRYVFDIRSLGIYVSTVTLDR
jgi:hypothetical protein